MQKAPKIIVIGAGIIGASIAWHLVDAGADVTVIDGAEAGGIATARSFAWINASWGNPEPYFRLRVRAIAEWRRLADVVPDLSVAWTGGLSWDMPPEQLEAHARQHGSWGYGVRRVDEAQARRIEPNVATPPAFALHVAGEASVEPWTAARALLADARARGARLRLRTPVSALTQRNGTITGVETGDEVLAADEIVVAAGVGAEALLASAGHDFPMSAPPGLLTHSRPHARILNGIVLAPKLHMRQTAEGRVVSGSDFGGADPGADAAATARSHFARVKAMLLGAEDLELDHYTIGHRPTPAGGFPVVGRIDGRQGLFVAVTHSGITLAPAIGLFAADEILTGRRDPLIAPFGARRKTPVAAEDRS